MEGDLRGDVEVELDDEQKQRIASATLEVADALTEAECRLLIDAACARAERVGWGEERHHDFVTEDVKVWNLEDPDARSVFEQRVERRMCEALAEGFRIPREQVQVSDAFVVRYRVGAQTSLDFHRDGSIFSGIVSLSASTDYEGGGTAFESGALHRPERGSGILFFGQRGHAGAEVTGGTRYILTLFFEFDGFSTEDLVDMIMLADDV